MRRYARHSVKFLPELGNTLNHRGTILVAEDTYQIQYLIRYLLERAQFRVEVASDGLEAAHLIETLAPPSLVLLDIMLPHMDGFQLLQRIRGRANWAATPVIMLSGKSHAHDMDRALASGANAYMLKPFQPETLVPLVVQWVSDSPS